MYAPIQTWNPPLPEGYQCCWCMRIQFLDTLALTASLYLSLPVRQKRNFNDYRCMCIKSTVRTGEVPSPKHAKSTIGIAVGWSATVPGMVLRRTWTIEPATYKLSIWLYQFVHLTSQNGHVGRSQSARHFEKVRRVRPTFLEVVTLDLTKVGLRLVNDGNVRVLNRLHRVY